MFLKLRPRTFAIGLLVFSSLWVAATLLPLLYSVFFPPGDLRGIVRALEMRGTAPPQATAIVQQTIAEAGPLRRAVQVGFYSGIAATFRLHASHYTKKTQVSYLAWFQKIRKPLILVIDRYESDGVLHYEIAEAEGGPVGFARLYVLPLLALGVSLYLVRRRKLLKDSAS
jgi:hypothetical protein